MIVAIFGQSPRVRGEIGVGGVIGGELAMRSRTRHLATALGASGALTVVAAIIGWLAGGTTAAVGAAAGVVLVAVSYAATTLAVAWADTVNFRMVFPVGMAMYLIKFSLLGAMLIAVGASDWSGKIPMALGICAGVVAWTAAHVWWLVHHAHPYVDSTRG